MPTRPIRLLLMCCLLLTCAVLSPLGVGVSFAHPTADFDWAPKPVVAGEMVTFTSTSTPFHEPFAPITITQWTIEGAGTLMGSNVSVRAPAPGSWRVELNVWDAIGEDGEETKTIDVVAPPPPPPPPPPVNQPPKPAMAVLPTSPLVGEEVTFVSYSEDPDGRISEHAWDMDGDGAFDESGAVATRRFSTAGPKRVTLRVKDDGGAFATVSRTVVVVQPAPAGTSAAPRLLSPFPVVRLVGSLVSEGVMVRMLAVRAPTGAPVLVRCSGKGCPVKRVKKKAGKVRLRVKAFEGELPAGVVLEVFVRSSDRIGKYTRFKIRRNRIPQRTDGCLRPGTVRRTACP